MGGAAAYDSTGSIGANNATSATSATKALGATGATGANSTIEATRTRGASGGAAEARGSQLLSIPRRGRERGRWLGEHGENAAAHYLKEAGYRVVERNWVCRDPDLRGELDLIACLRRTLVVCEVKTRSTDRLASPAEAVTRAKAIRLRRLGVRWLSGQRSRRAEDRLIERVTELRIDVIAIRTMPGPPYSVLTLDHLFGVA
jgi:putative endonuclease